MNGAPAPLAEDEDSDFGHESWYDRKEDKDKTKGRRSGKQAESRKSGVKDPVDGDDDRVANFNLLDPGLPSDESDEESFLDSSHSKPHSHLYICPQSDQTLLGAETPAFILERRGQHKPLSSYFEDAVLDREGSVGHETESRLQEGIKRGGNVNAVAGVSDVETPTNRMVRSTPSDSKDSITGKSRSSHHFAHDALTSPAQSQKRKPTSRRSYSP